MELEFHPVSELFPLIEGAEFEELKADIKERGLLEKITLHPNGRILDGRNRYRACKELGIDFETTTWKDNGNPTSFVISRNLLRRHLLPGQRSCIAVEAVKLRKRLEEEAKQRMIKGKKDPNKNSYDLGQAVDKLGKLFNVSRDSIYKADRLKKQDPVLFQNVKVGKKTLNRAIVEHEKKKYEDEKPESKPGTKIFLFRFPREMIIEAEAEDKAWRIFLDLIKRKATIKELKGRRMNFVDFLRAIHLGGVINDCKIECRGDSIYCEAFDLDNTMKLEALWKTKIDGFRKGQVFAIFDIRKLIRMVSHPKSGDRIWIESDDLNGKLHYEGTDEKIVYTLADPEIIDEANIEKTIESFLKEEAIEFILTPYEMKKIIKKSGAFLSDFMRFYTDNEFVNVEIGGMDRLSTEVGEYKKLIEDVDSVSVYLDSRITSSIFKIGIQLQGTIRMSIKTDFPAVIKLENIGQAINVAYLTSPGKKEDMS